MCLYNMKTKKIELHNDALGKILGIYTDQYMGMIETALLRPKKKKIIFDDPESLVNMRKDFLEV